MRLGTMAARLRRLGSCAGRVTLAAIVASTLAVPPAAAQFPFFWERQQPQPQQRRQRAAPPPQQPQSRSFFDLFGDDDPGPQTRPVAPKPPPAPVDYSRAPAPRKPETQPATRILVLGDSMADWLAYGLEDALSDTPELGVVRKSRTFSGLLRYDNRPDSSWAQVAREAIAAEKPDFIVMMLGINDRQPIREPVRPPAPSQKRAPGAGPETPAQAPNAPDQMSAGRPAAGADDDDAGDQPILTPEEQRQAANSSVLDYRSDRWAAAYSRRIDEVIAVLKTANVPVIWVGLPALRGTRSTSDMLYLNGLYRAAAAKADIFYVDPWDGFVDEAGRFSLQGPDFEGQIRRLRTSDGVHFTKAGARKLAHYVDKEIQRLRTLPVTPVSLPVQPDAAPQPAEPGSPPPPQVAEPAGPPPRPLAGPVFPLALGANSGGDELLGGPSGQAAASAADPLAATVMVKGEALAAAPGRADDFTWPREKIVYVETAPGATPVIEPPMAVASAPANASGPRTASVPSSPSAARARASASAQRQQAQARQMLARRNMEDYQPRGGFFGLFDGGPPRPPGYVGNNGRQQQRAPSRGSGFLFGLFD